MNPSSVISCLLLLGAVGPSLQEPWPEQANNVQEQEDIFQINNPQIQQHPLSGAVEKARFLAANLALMDTKIQQFHSQMQAEGPAIPPQVVTHLAAVAQDLYDSLMAEQVNAQRYGYYYYYKSADSQSDTPRPTGDSANAQGYGYGYYKSAESQGTDTPRPTGDSENQAPGKEMGYGYGYRGYGRRYGYYGK